MPAVSSPPVLVNVNPGAVAPEYLGAGPPTAGAPGIVAERVGHIHGLGRSTRGTTGMGLYGDVDPTDPNCAAYLSTAAGVIPALPVWTWEGWIWTGNGMVGGANVNYLAGVFAQGTAVSTANPNGLTYGIHNHGGGAGAVVWDCGDGTLITLTMVANTWYHVAAVFNGRTLTVYVNGVVAGTHTPVAGGIPANSLIGFGATEGNSSSGRIRMSETRLSNIPRYTAPFTPQETPFTPDSATVGLWLLSDLPFGNWGVYYETGGTSPAPGGQPLAAGWHWIPSASFDSSGQGNDLGIALDLTTDIAIYGSVIYSAGIAGITAADGVVRAPSVTSLNAQTGDVVLEDGHGNGFAFTPGNGTAATVVTIPGGALDGTASDIQPVAGIPSAGSVGLGADAGHQHVGVHSVTAGTNVTISGTASDPVINASGGGGGGGGSGPGVPIGLTHYDPASVTTYTPSTSLASVDSSNLTVSFTVPASGTVLVVLSGNVRASSANAADWLAWGLTTHGTTTLVSELINVLQQVSQPGGGLEVNALLSVPFYITGLTPGASVTWDWAFKTSGTGANQAQMQAGTSGGLSVPALMQVFDGTLGDTTWTPPTLGNSWANVAGWSPAGFRKDALGFVHVRGRISGGSGGTVAFTLPAGYRPGGGTMQFPGIGTDGGDGSVTAVQNLINTAGAVTIEYQGSSARVSLDGITFLAEN